MIDRVYGGKVYRRELWECGYCKATPDAFHCGLCDRHISSQRMHGISASGQVTCPKCLPSGGVFASYSVALKRCAQHCDHGE